MEGGMVQHGTLNYLALGQVVRGAYMALERERAARLALPSPIHPTVRARPGVANRPSRFPQ
jgi:hypothetical protein